MLLRAPALCILWTLIAITSGRAEENVPLLSAHGAVQKVDNTHLTVRIRGTDGKFAKPLTLILTGTSKISEVSTRKQSEKTVIVQRVIDPGDLHPDQLLAVVYTESPAGPVLLTAVAQPATASKTTDSGTKLPAGVPAKVAAVLEHVDEHKEAPKGFEGGRRFLNLGRDGEESLPRKTSSGKQINYQEWDVNPHIQGKNRGAERLVTGSDGSAYYTSDHYRTFKKIR
jgi:guanyl-specific ribonuclease Sa